MFTALYARRFMERGHLMVQRRVTSMATVMIIGPVI